MELDKLNPGQRAAVEYCDGPQLVIAGAGSGKTRVLTYKIAYIMDSKGFEPWNVLALTFTNKAANEMKLRIGKLVGNDKAHLLHMGTFHSIFSRILRVEADKLGYTSEFTIYDETDSRSLLKSIIKEMQLDDKTYKPAGVHTVISMAKNHLVMPEQFKNPYYEKQPALDNIYVAYQQRLQKANAMDFDDLLVLTWRLFNEHDDIRQKYAYRFSYVLVDEYQDTNYVQQCIVLQLTKEHRHVCVVGDDAQSIYGFRGANIDNILGFNEVYPDSKLFKLEQNYRSTQYIVQAANSLIRHNTNQISKDVFSKNAEGEKLIYKPVYSDKEEASVVCREIKRIKRQDDCDYSDFVILYRTNSQSRSFEEEMRKPSVNIPYRIYGGLSFYQRKEIKDILAYFRLIANPNDEEAIKRVINYPARGIGNTTISKIAYAAQNKEVSFWEVIKSPLKYGLDVNKGTASKLNGFIELIDNFITELSDTDAYTLGMEVIKQSGISEDLYLGKDPDAIARQENLNEFLNGLKDFVDIRMEEGNGNNVSIADFLQEVSLLTDLDSDDEDTSRVSLMTIHSAKGLEFPTVFIVGLEENIFPSPMSAASPRELEEERRLLYVAITRAEKHCVLTSAKNRWRFGKMEFDSPSRFLMDIEPSLMYVDDGSDRLSLHTRPVRTTRMPDSHIAMPRHLTPVAKISGNVGRKADNTIPPKSIVEGLHVGSTIEHMRFGIGTVEKIEGDGENQKATVIFRNTGTKQLLLKFAKFNIIET